MPSARATPRHPRRAAPIHNERMPGRCLSGTECRLNAALRSRAHGYPISRRVAAMRNTVEPMKLAAVTSWAADLGDRFDVEIAGVDPGEGEADSGEADEVRPHGAAREDGFDVVHDSSFLRWGWSRGRLGSGTGSLRRGGVGREREGFALDRHDARLPAATEGRPSREALEEGETLALERPDGLPRRPRAAPPRASPVRSTPSSATAEDALQEPRRASWAGVHGEVEDGMVETGRQVVAAQPDSRRSGGRSRRLRPWSSAATSAAETGRPRARASVAAVIPRLVAPPGSTGWFDESALVPEDVRERRLEAVRSHEMILCWVMSERARSAGRSRSRRRYGKGFRTRPFGGSRGRAGRRAARGAGRRRTRRRPARRSRRSPRPPR